MELSQIILIHLLWPVLNHIDAIFHAYPIIWRVIFLNIMQDILYQVNKYKLNLNIEDLISFS